MSTKIPSYLDAETVSVFNVPAFRAWLNTDDQQEKRRVLKTANPRAISRYFGNRHERPQLLGVRYTVWRIPRGAIVIWVLQTGQEPLIWEIEDASNDPREIAKTIRIEFQRIYEKLSVTDIRDYKVNRIHHK